ncbi:MAG: hypothetical protein KGJ13_01740 [Patescibacteria group bacterium]|nr:hypothetical protein [Patescibacteria group bacterium]
MKKFFTRTSFIALSALSLVWGIPGQARAADGGCAGRTLIQRKTHGRDVAGFVAAFIGRITGSDRTTSCVELKPFTSPALKPISMEMPILPAPPKVRFSHPLPKLADLGLPMSLPTIERRYEVVLTIQAATAQANGIVPGTFPANYLENQKKDGTWKKRQRIIAKVSEANEGLVCQLFLKHAPAKNSAVAVDFQNGNSIEVASNMLQGKKALAVIPPEPKKDHYQALADAYRVKPPFLLTALRGFILPTGAPTAIGWAAMGPFGALMPAASFVQGIAMRKIAANDRTLAAAQHPSLHTEYVLANQENKIGAQDTRIRTLELQLQALQKELASLRQTATVKTAATADQRRK